MSTQAPVRLRKMTAPEVESITFSLISHTNVGKTTLARTLLRRDVGETLDQPHVTDISEAYPMIDSDGWRLLLWDTPGFGDTPRLLKRLKKSTAPLRWLLAQLWDKFTDRPLWCSQQAVKNVQEEADVVLYLVNASEKPQEAGYVALEMEILTWIGKPVVLLLNQTGPPRNAIEDELDVAEWRIHLKKFEVVREVIGLDAFARCWVQEDELLEVVTPLLQPEKRQGYDALRTAWRRKNLDVFGRSMAVLGRQLAESVCDRVSVSKERVLQKLGVGRGELKLEMEAARGQLSARLADRSVKSTDELIRMHELTGHSAASLTKVGEENFIQPQQVNESLWSAVGGVLTGAAAGVAADIHSGGMTLGGGTLLGVFLGGAGSYLLAKGYNLARGSKDFVRWTEEHFAAQAETVVLFYLAVAHWGRGRGEWADSEHPQIWKEEVRRVIESERKRLDALWNRGGSVDAKPDDLRYEAAGILTDCVRVLLQKLYPKVRIFSEEKT